MKIENINKIEVYYKDKHVGLLIQNGDSTCSFVYTYEWLENGFTISPFKLPLEDKEFICDDYLVNYMFGVFYDCLPDSWGNYLVDKYLISQGINPRNVSLLQRLTLLGEDSLGALSFKPNFEEKNTENANDFDEIKKKIEELEKGDRQFDEDLFDLYHQGSPTGGSRPKVNYSFDDGEYIVKFPSKVDDKNIGLSEYKMNELAKKCGLNVPEHKLIPSKVCKGYFATKRFDRVNGTRKHVISLAGLFDLDSSLSQIHYKGFLQTVKVLCPQDIEEAVKRMIFNYLINNKDDHPRNFSFIYDEEINQYRLAPFFDITSTPYINEHMMQVNGKDSPELEDFINDAKAGGLSKEKTIKIYNDLKKIIDNNL